MPTHTEKDLRTTIKVLSRIIESNNENLNFFTTTETAQQYAHMHGLYETFTKSENASLEQLVLHLKELVENLEKQSIENAENTSANANENTNT